MQYNKKVVDQLKDIQNKTVVVRCDYNVPIQNGVISDATRIEASLQTLNYLLSKNCKLVILSHLSRIKSLDDIKSNKKSLRPVYEYLKNHFADKNVVFEQDNTAKDLKQKIANYDQNTIVVLENTRYCDVNENNEVVKKESKCDEELAKFWASLGDVFVNDAFGTAHRKHASNDGIARHTKYSATGFLVANELKQLQKALNNPKKPVVAIFGGVKISGKIDTIKHIATFADHILVGGAMVYTFLKAMGHEIGISLYEKDALDLAKSLLATLGDKLVLPVDVVCAKDPESKGQTYDSKNMPADLEGFDIGQKTADLFASYINKANTIIWNGPLGLFENPNFANGTRKVAEAIAKRQTSDLDVFSVVGGGDSAAAVTQFGLESKFAHVSTGGGASLEFLTNLPLKGIENILDKNQESNPNC